MVQGLSEVERQYGVKGRDLDQAYWYVQESGSHKEGQVSDIELKALRRKIDWWIIPIMFCCYTMQFIDKVSLNVGICIKSRSGGQLAYHSFSMRLLWVLTRTCS
jgi:hypothetical protein